MIKTKKLFNSGIKEDTSIRDKYRIRFINAMILFFVPLYIAYSFINYNKGFYIFTILDITNIFILSFAYKYLRVTSNIEKTSYAILISPIPIFIVAFFEGGIHNTAFFWFFLFPLWAIFLKGGKKGLKIISLFLLVIISFYIYATYLQIELPYNKNMLLILIFALIFESAIVLYYESVRRKYDKIIITQNKELSDYQYKLENKVVQQEQELLEIQRDIIFTMGSIGESRSRETANHVKRVAGYSELFARLLGFEDNIITMIHQASPMHDIGKVGIPDSILHKPGKLDSDEFEVMKTHSQLGYNLLKNSDRSLLKMAATISYEHHEKYDGSGYPNALKADEIHIYARITAVADVFDALGSDRVYKKAWDDEKIFSLLKSESGKHFDPVLIKLFFDNLDQFLAIRDKYID